MPGVGEEQEHPVGSAIALLERDLPIERLRIRRSRLRLDAADIRMSRDRGRGTRGSLRPRREGHRVVAGGPRSATSAMDAVGGAAVRGGPHGPHPERDQPPGRASARLPARAPLRFARRSRAIPPESGRLRFVRTAGGTFQPRSRPRSATTLRSGEQPRTRSRPLSPDAVRVPSLGRCVAAGSPCTDDERVLFTGNYRGGGGAPGSGPVTTGSADRDHWLYEPT
jgi:hypothetical protein